MLIGSHHLVVLARFCLHVSLHLFLLVKTATLGFFMLLLLLAKMFALRLITCDTVVSWCVSMAKDGCLEELKQILVLVGFMLTALLRSVDASALLVWNRSFLFLSVTIVLSKSLIVHPSESSFEVEAVLIFFTLNFFSFRLLLTWRLFLHCLIGLELKLVSI